MNNLSVGLFNPNLDSFTQLNVSIRLAAYPESWDSTKAKFLLVGNYHCKSFVHIWAGLLLSEWGENTRVTYHEEYGPGPLYSLVRHLHHEEIGEDKQYHLATLHLKRLVNHGHRTKTNLSTSPPKPQFFSRYQNLHTFRGLFCISFSDKSLPTINHGKYPGKKTMNNNQKKSANGSSICFFLGAIDYSYHHESGVTHQGVPKILQDVSVIVSAFSIYLHLYWQMNWIIGPKWS